MCKEALDVATSTKLQTTINKRTNCFQFWKPCIGISMENKNIQSRLFVKKGKERGRCWTNADWNLLWNGIFFFPLPQILNCGIIKVLFNLSQFTYYILSEQILINKDHLSFKYIIKYMKIFLCEDCITRNFFLFSLYHLVGWLLYLATKYIAHNKIFTNNS